MTDFSEEENAKVFPIAFGVLAGLTMGLLAGLTSKGVVLTGLTALFSGCGMYLLTRDWR